MRRDLCLKAALCLLVSLQAMAMATEVKTGQGPLPPLENYRTQNSPKLSPEYKRRTTGSNSSAAAAGKGQLHVLLSSSDQGKHVLDPSVFVFEDGKGQMPPAAPNEKKPSSVAALPYDPDEDKVTGRLLVAVARTLVTSTASTTTIAVFSTCQIIVAGVTACTGRKKRQLWSSRRAIMIGNSEAVLDSSLETIEGGSKLVNKLNMRTGRFILWSSSITTVTIRTTTTNTATTVSASFPCSAAGLMTCG